MFPKTSRPCAMRPSPSCAAAGQSPPVLVERQRRFFPWVPPEHVLPTMVDPFTRPRRFADAPHAPGHRFTRLHHASENPRSRRRPLRDGEDPARPRRGPLARDAVRVQRSFSHMQAGCPRVCRRGHCDYPLGCHHDKRNPGAPRLRPAAISCKTGRPLRPESAIPIVSRPGRGPATARVSTLS